MSFECINIAEAKTLLEENDVRIADIRDAMSFNENHMKDAVNVNNENLPQFLQNTPKDAPLIICCYHGNSSKQAAQFFAEQGYTRVFSLDGGFEMWKMAVPELCAR
ncbi:MAG: thiosulfate sulfurtransferase GlpE [Thalassolituus sp.]|jgi:thiosulfate sulfurtransferase|nr:thiosulfate sulfurtransferase GlpE [Pseudomonadota bacterium]TNC85547.1 MAG: thiosulfate sulfurtransferase GlpE [Thalassolituus sp.]|tara:strand:- start:366 stop:683 length:318 start_codon:yes stop_codon:yes gene_type:complete